MIKTLLKFWNWLIGKSFKKGTVKKDYTEYHVTAFDYKVFDEINNYRISKSLHRLEFLGGDLLNITYSYPFWLVDNEIGHDDKHSFFNERADQIILRYRNVRVGENIGFGYTKPKAVVEAWSRSEGHRKTMEGDFQYIAVASCGRYTNTIYIR